MTEKWSGWFWAILAVYLLGGFILYFPLRYQVNPDAISYLTIAKNYSRGYWMDAVNAYWSPLISWVIALFCRIPVDPLFIFKWYNLIVGMGGLFACNQLMQYLGIKSYSRNLFLSILAIIFLRFVFSVTTPDLTVTVLLLFFLPYWLTGKLLRKPLITGTWIALLYFAKAYNFFFVTGLLVFEVASLVVQKELPIKRILGNILLLYGVFFILASPWLWALHHKYGYFMLAGTAKFNHGAARYDNYAYMLRFVAPPHSHSVFAWEDPVLKSGFRDYSVFESRENFLFQLKIVWKNLLQFLTGATNTLLIVFIGTILMIVSYLIRIKELAGMPAIGKWLFKNEYFKIFAFSTLYISGYLLIFVEDRYVWTSVVLSVIAGAFLFDYFLSVDKRRWLYFALFLVLDIILAWHSLYSNFFKAPPHYKEIAIAEYRTSRRFISLPPEKKKMAKWPDDGGYTLFGSWYVAYFSEGSHYFSLPADISKANELIEGNGISIVFVPAGTEIPEGFVIKNWTKISDGIPESIIYQRP
ncbi:hypothetical protein [Flavihumibacter profundi]|uniref:hypothetical protein n=1 Tax=Flavihumibacter profundi TaxID=2716883 RepID=UPI001CC5B23B|nr:hypothetical protein [Flavihumibacter profundi]MBZ5857457.1 hypothetical protein [Flavihumibacter profundi]